MDPLSVTEIIRRGRAAIPSAQPTLPNNEEPESKQLAQVNTRVPDSLHQRFVYPEFLPDPKMEWRNSIREKLERTDMMKRRSQIGLPEFYVGEFRASVSEKCP